VDAGATNFTARATAVQDFDGDGVFNVWEINQDRKVTETVKD
jgi:type IV pilus assembly protein PilE